MHPIFTSLLSAANSTGYNLNPASTNALPGEATLSSLASGVGHWALLAAILGVIVGGVMWGFIQQTFRTVGATARLNGTELADGHNVALGLDQPGR